MDHQTITDADYYDLGFSSSREFSTHGSRNQPATQRLRAPRSANVKLGSSLLSQQIQRQQGSTLDSSTEQYVSIRPAMIPSDPNILSSFSGSAGATISQSNESAVISERERQVQLSLTILRARSGKSRTGRSTSASVSFSGSAASVADNDSNQASASSPIVDNSSSSFSGYHTASYNNSYLQRKVLMSQQQRSPVVNRAPSASRLRGGPSSGGSGSVSPVRYQSWGTTSAWTAGAVEESIANNNSPIRSPKEYQPT